MSQPAVRRFTYAEYLAHERETGMRHEYLDGEVRLMAGGSVRHAAMKTRLTMLVGAALDGGPCMPFDADLRIHVVATGLTTYPDLSVVCGPLERSPRDRNALTNPVLLVEVLSPSTERWDRGGKFAHVQQIASLRHYVLVSLEEARVEHFARGEGGTWTYRSLGPGASLRLDHPPLTIPVDRLFDGLPEDEAPDEGA